MKRLYRLVIILVLVFGVLGLIQDMPEGTSIVGAEHKVPDGSVTFLQDVTYIDIDGIRQSDQEIFDEMFTMIDEAERYILLEMFLFNDFLGTATSYHRGLSGELTDALVKKKEENKDITIILITDPINEIYGGYKSPQLERLRASGVEVVMTDLTKLRDSNPLYSGFYRVFFHWFGNSTTGGILPNLFDARAGNLTLRTYLSLFNFKANHRKVVLTDSGDKFSVLITSANPHDGSSAHTNTALRVDDLLWKDVLASQLAVADFSKVDVTKIEQDFLDSINDSSGEVIVQLLTEGKIREAIINEINSMEEGDSFDMSMFYFSDRKVINALMEADKRGVMIRILLDPNKDAFGREKSGIPNRPVAYELMKNSINNTQIRFCHTNGEQCHSKFLIFNKQDEEILIKGSANLTRRNIGDFNLETNILVRGSDVSAINDTQEFFEKVWTNKDGKLYSVDFEVYKDDSKIRYILYRIMEGTGMSTF